LTVSDFWVTNVNHILFLTLYSKTIIMHLLFFVVSALVEKAVLFFMLKSHDQLCVSVPQTLVEPQTLTFSREHQLEMFMETSC